MIAIIQQNPEGRKISMKKLFVLLISSLIISTIGCSTIDVATAKNAHLGKKLKKVAVFPFKINGAQWGAELSDVISHNFFKKAGIEIVEREAMNKILKEQNLSMTGLVDQTKALEIGRMVGADLIIMGRGSALKVRRSKGGDYYANLLDTFSLKAIDVEKGTMIMTVRKKSGRDWDGEYRAKFCCSLSLVWDRTDVLVQSSNYDELAGKIVDKILFTVKQIEQAKAAAKAVEAESKK